MEFKSRKLQFTYDGTPHQLRFPSVGEIQKFAKDGEKKDVDDFENAISFVSSLGVDKKVLKGLEADHFKQLVEALTGEKKS